MKNIIQYSLFMVLFFAVGCVTNITHRVQYPPSSELFVTSGDDPGSESLKPYVPKGQFIHITQEFYLPFPVLGMFIKFGDAEPQAVFDRYVIPRVREMGADALTTANVQYTPPSPILWGLLGLRTGGMTVITGQAVKK